MNRRDVSELDATIFNFPGLVQVYVCRSTAARMSLLKNDQELASDGSEFTNESKLL